MYQNCQWLKSKREAQWPFFSAADSGSSSPGLSPGWGYCIVFLGKTLDCHTASLRPGVQIGPSEFMLGVTLR